MDNNDLYSRLRDSWGKESFVISSYIEKNRLAVSLDDLLELAKREDVESRMVSHIDENRPKLEHGPFDNRIDHFLNDGKTLIIQGADLFLTEIKSLVEEFSFLPKVFYDDIMISYSPEGGTVFPHFDFYHVFIIQAKGQKRWQVQKNFNKKIKDGVELKVLEEFTPEQEWVLDKGDLIYIPPDMAHYGVAMSEGASISIGLRSIEANEFINDFLQDSFTHRSFKGFFDLQYSELKNDKHILERNIKERLKSFVLENLFEKDTFDEFLARNLTTPKRLPEPDFDLTYKEFYLQWEEGLSLYKDEYLKFVFSDESLWVNGHEFKSSLWANEHTKKKWSELLFGFSGKLLEKGYFDKDELRIVFELYQIGALYFVDES